MDDIGLFGGKPEISAAPAPDYDALWSDYNSWVLDIEGQRADALSQLDYAFSIGGGLSPEAYQAEKSRINAEADSQLKTLSSGPTYQLLYENFQAQTTPKVVQGGGVNTDRGSAEVTERVIAPASQAKTLEEFYGVPKITSGKSPTAGVSTVAPARPTTGKRGPAPEFSEGSALLDRPTAEWFYV